MRFSIGVPTYNQARYLRATIRSLMSQVVPPYEIVVSNNHSSDETAEVLKAFTGAVRIVSPPEHLDMMAHWNFVVAQTTGDWVALLSSDDVAGPNYVQGLRRGIASCPKAVLVRAGYELIDGEGNVLERRRILTVPRIARFPGNVLEQVRGPKVNFAAFAIKREGWSAVGGFPEECKFFGDWGMWLKLAPIGEFVYVDECISQYRIAYGQGQSLTRLYGEFQDEVWIYGVLMPELYRRYGAPKQSIIDKVFAQRFSDRIKYVSRTIHKDDRFSFVEKMRPYAGSVETTKMLHEFMNGKIWAADRPIGGLGKLLRTAYGEVRYCLWR